MEGRMKIVFVCGDFWFDFGESWRHVPAVGSRVIYEKNLYDVVRVEVDFDNNEFRVILVDGEEYGTENQCNGYV